MRVRARRRDLLSTKVVACECCVFFEVAVRAGEEVWTQAVHAVRGVVSVLAVQGVVVPASEERAQVVALVASDDFGGGS